MKTSKQVLPGVKAVYWLDCNSLPNRVDLRGICGMPVEITARCTPVGIAPGATCSCLTERDGRGWTDTASLAFVSDEALPQWQHAAFIVIDINDRTFLIGAKEQPFPQVRVNRRSGSPEGDSAGFAYEVTHVALKTMLPCIIET